MCHPSSEVRIGKPRHYCVGDGVSLQKLGRLAQLPCVCLPHPYVGEEQPKEKIPKAWAQRTPPPSEASEQGFSCRFPGPFLSSGLSPTSPQAVPTGLPLPQCQESFAYDSGSSISLLLSHSGDWSASYLSEASFPASSPIFPQLKIASAWFTNFILLGPSLNKRLSHRLPGAIFSQLGLLRLAVLDITREVTLLYAPEVTSKRPHPKPPNYDNSLGAWTLIPDLILPEPSCSGSV